MTYLSRYELRKRTLLLLAFSLLVIYASTAGSSLVAGNGLTVNPNSGPPGTPVTVTGSGFSSKDTQGVIIIGNAAVGECTISAGTITSIASTPSMPCGFNVPSLAPGPYIVSVFGNVAHDEEDAPFQILGYTPTIQLSPTSGLDGQSVTVTGSGFNPQDSSCSIASSIVEGGYTCSVPGAGSVGGSFTVAGQPGIYNIEVIGSTGDSANSQFTILGSTPPPAPSIGLSPNHGPAGTSVFVNGDGFSSIDSQGVVAVETGGIADCIINGGALSCPNPTFNFPDYAPGPHTVTVTGNGASDSASATFTVESTPPPSTPSVQLRDPNTGGSSGYSGDTVTFAGSGFSLQDSSCTIASSIVMGGYTCNVDNAGDVTGSLTVIGQSGTYTIQVIGSTGDSAPAPFTIVPSQSVVTPTQQATTAGTTAAGTQDFRIQGNPVTQSVAQGGLTTYTISVDEINGFSSQITLSLSGMPTSAHGVFSIPAAQPGFSSILTVTVPADAEVGTYTFTVTGSGGGISHATQLVLTIINAVTNTTGTTTAASAPTSVCNLPGCFNSYQVILVILAVAVAWLVLRRLRKPTPTKGNAPSGASAFCPGCGGRLPDHYHPCPVNDKRAGVGT